MKRSYLVVVAAVAVVCLSQFASAAEVDLFLLAGQSNAYGRPTYAGDSPPVLSSDSGVLFDEYSQTPAGTLTTLATRYNGPYSTGVVGPEVGLGRTLQSGMPTKKIAIFKYAVGGASIRDWERQDHSDQYWSAGEKLYPDFIAKVQACIATIRAQGDTPVLSGFAWFQGENGATTWWEAYCYQQNPNDPAGWAFRDHTKQFLIDVRNDLGAPNMPIMETRISDQFYNSQFLSATAAAQGNTVAQVTAAVDHRRQEQEAVVAQLSNTYLISSDGLTANPNQGSDATTWFHFTPSSYITLGNRMGQAYLTNVPEPATLTLLGLGGLLLAKRRRTSGR